MLPQSRQIGHTADDARVRGLAQSLTTVGTGKDADDVSDTGIPASFEVERRVTDYRNLPHIHYSDLLHGSKDHERCWPPLGHLVAAHYGINHSLLPLQHAEDQVG
jgi:hypothetical protein